MIWYDLFMNMCDCVARKSKDTSTKVGAVIVGPDNEVRSVGFNGFPRGVKDTPSKNIFPVGDGFLVNNDQISKRFERPLKYKFTEHAERNAIYNAARMGTALNGCTIFINSLPPCTDCARAIIQSGIVKVVIRKGEVPERWKEDCNIARKMLRECDVTVWEH